MGPLVTVSAIRFPAAGGSENPPHIVPLRLMVASGLTRVMPLPEYLIDDIAMDISEEAWGLFFIDLNPLHRARNIFACFYPVYSHNGKPFDINRTIHHAEAISGSDASKMWRGDMILMSVRHACADNISDMLNANTILDLKQAVLSVCPPVREDKSLIQDKIQRLKHKLSIVKGLFSLPLHGSSILEMDAIMQEQRVIIAELNPLIIQVNTSKSNHGCSSSGKMFDLPRPFQRGVTG